jgi:hypothetical protein
MNLLKTNVYTSTTKQGNGMKTKLLIFTNNGEYFGSTETYLVPQLINAYAAIGLNAFELPRSLQEQAF